MCSIVACPIILQPAILSNPTYCRRRRIQLTRARHRCLVPTRNDWFRALMCYILLASVASLFSFTWIEVEVSYAEVSDIHSDLANGQVREATALLS